MPQTGSIVAMCDLTSNGARHPRDACGMLGMARRQLRPLGQLEIREVESGRDRATEQAIRRLGRQLDGEPRPGRDHELRARAGADVEAETAHLPGPRRGEEEHVERTAFVEVKNLV